MAKKSSALAGIFDDPEPEIVAPPAVEPPAAQQTETRPAPRAAAKPRARRGAGEGASGGRSEAPARRDAHPGKKAVMIHIPEDMHRTLRQLSVEEGGEPMTVITERLLREYLVKRGHTRFAR